MKITKIETLLFTGPCSLDPYISRVRKHRSAAFIRINTDTELTGLGETYAGYFFPEIIPRIVGFFEPILLGKNPENIPRLYQEMYYCGNYWCRNGLGAAVLTGIEAALWDLKGKAEGQPVYELLGGRKHDSIPAYATGGPSNYPLNLLADKIDYYLSLGFTGIKVGAGAYFEDKGWVMKDNPAETAEFEGEKASFMRRHAGPGIKLMLDSHMSNSPHRTWDLSEAEMVMKAVEGADLFFFEEPLHYNDIEGYRELCRRSPVPIAGGECLTVFSEWLPYIKNDAFHIAQPDASFTGGLGEFMKIADAFGAAGKRIAAHAWGSGGSLMQNIHCAFAAENSAILEVPPAFGPLHTKIMKDSFRMKNGKVLPPDTPGLGIDIPEDFPDEFPFVPGSGEYNSVPGKKMEG